MYIYIFYADAELGNNEYI